MMPPIYTDLTISDFSKSKYQGEYIVIICVISIHFISSYIYIYSYIFIYLLYLLYLILSYPFTKRIHPALTPLRTRGTNLGSGLSGGHSAATFRSSGACGGRCRDDVSNDLLRWLSVEIFFGFVFFLQLATNVSFSLVKKHDADHYVYVVSKNGVYPEMAILILVRIGTEKE